MEEEARLGFYKDESGEWSKDRRRSEDRRHNRADHPSDQRQHKRRKSDREWIDREHRKMVEDALEDFASEHGET